MKWSKSNIVAIILCLFYGVGVIGISVDGSRPNMLTYTPMNLILTGVLFYIGQATQNRRFYLVSFLVMLLGFLVEVAGVQTGKLFGVYQYGSTLGYKLQEVPLTIGINWFVLSFGCLGVARTFFKNRILVVFIATVLMVLLDFLIEPVAIKLDFWNWADSIIPIKNYVMWFIFSLIIIGIIEYFKIKINRKVAFSLVIVQFLFFGILNFTLC